MLGGGGDVSHPLQLTTGLVIKSITTSPTLADEHMLFILQVSILSEQMRMCMHTSFLEGFCQEYRFLPSLAGLGGMRGDVTGMG